MSVRNQLYLSLIKELLGPRAGSTELMKDDPRTEYVTGILEPKGFVRSGPLEDYTKSDVTTYQSDEEFEEDRTERGDDFEVNPASSLDPRSFPKSMGISFVVKSETFPLIHLCATWARYVKEKEGWRRVPGKHVELNWEVSTDQKSWTAASGVRIVLRSISLGENRRHISIYLVNDTKIDSTILTTPYLIFQPEIRIKLVSGLLESIDERGIEGPEEQRLDLLYRNLPALARGHLCGAVWKGIDPARPVDQKKKDISPLLPEDMKLLSDSEKEFFDWPDIRTDYLPAYSISQSITDAASIGLETEDTAANSLAEKWDPELLSSCLKKIPSSYRDWIAAQESEISRLSREHKSIASENIKDCNEALERIESGIQILKTDDDARLAFCFMNMAMDTQAMWTRGQHLEWRPFQMGFILQCIRGIVQEDHIDRKYCDLLWFPTGGGKTEAYLALMIFTLAYRTRKHRKRGIEGIGGAGTAVISRYTLRLLTIQQFRRALNAITACDFLRIKDWTPGGFKGTEKHLWGRTRYSIGLWVGSEVTPNNVVDHVGFDKVRKMNTRFVGAIGILCNTQGSSSRRTNRESRW